MINKSKLHLSSDIELEKQNSNSKIEQNKTPSSDDNKIGQQEKNDNANKKPAVASTKTKTTVKKVDDPIVANFTVEGWPENKSRIATDYVNYDIKTAMLMPNQVFTSPDASKLKLIYFTAGCHLGMKIFLIFFNMI